MVIMTIMVINGGKMMVIPPGKPTNFCLKKVVL